MADDEQRVFGDVEAAADAFEHMPFPAAVTDGPELRIVAVNAAARALAEGRFVSGQPLGEIVGDALLGQGWFDAFRISMLTGETVTREGYRLQLPRSDGSRMELYLDAAFTARPGPDGRPRGTISVTKDVTERVRQQAAVQRELADLRERYSAVRGSVRAMQRALLADSVPVLSAFDVAARYVLATDEQAAGGDWFDAVPRPDGSAVLVVGDVVGHGQAAAVAMGQLRSVLLAQLRAGAGIVDAVTFLDRFARTVPAARHATVCVALVDGGTGAVEYCTAGHPPPLLVGSADGDTGYLPPSGAGPLGTGAAFPTATAQLDTGDALVLYTDGILERPGVTPAAGPVELRAAAADAYRNHIMSDGASSFATERICSLAIELLVRATGHRDDITVLALQRREPVPALDVRAEVGPAAAARCRAELRGWLQAIGTSAEDVGRLAHVATELVTNVLDHAYADLPARHPLRFTARLDQRSAVTIEVCDQGSWKVPMVTENRGRGLVLVRDLVDELEFDRAGGGTTARVRSTVSRPAGLLDRIAAVREPDEEHFDVYARGGPDPVVTVVGPLEESTIATVAALVNLALTEAADAVTVDLGRVTLLASAGVNLLFTAAEQAHAAGRRLDLIAPTGSPAQHILTLVGLAHRDAPAAV